MIVHAGFHKTGTTSVQRFLRANGKHIYPRCAMVLPARLDRKAAHMALRYSEIGSQDYLDAFGAELHETLSAIVPKNRSVLITDERLSGRMPGRDGQVGYPAAPALLARAEDVICDVFGTEADVVFHFSTRDPLSWLHSTYKHNLRVSRLNMDENEHRAAYALPGTLGDIADDVAKGLTGTVHTTDLADMTTDFGPAQPLIDLINLPAHLHKRLKPQPAANVGPKDGLIEDLLALNRAGLSDQALRAAKSALLGKAKTHDG
ncbi:hypothetical protein L0664_08255 [Octadecabacter sp. G9-8]|uniref:Sulfotransferase family protein n=1 Tax=Octadecabacter dasysiphoniae TaxID=2909341 RepID=A0ABS9CUW1_9RHOB|nr:hypothetical protein [Octadecabacter dasysiphoniae]MCF2871056.1 hypothetical protein [Octadecabacter dasysiphoniae]